MGNEGIYSMGKEFGKTLYLFAKQRVSWVPCKMAFLKKYSQIWQSSMTLQFLVMCFIHGLSWDSFSQASRELVVNCIDFSLKLDSSPISPAHSLQLKPT